MPDMNSQDNRHKEKKKSVASRAISEDGAHKTHVGGQALIEGVMMRGKYNWAASVRQPDGEMYVEEHELTTGVKQGSWLRKPLIRGCTALVESLVLGYKALEVSIEHAYADEDEEEEEKQNPADSKSCGEKEREVLLTGALTTTETDDSDSDSVLGKGAMTFSMVLGIVLGVAVFIIVPAVLTRLIVGPYSFSDSGVYNLQTLSWNIVDGVLRLAIFIAYVWLTARMKDIKRMYMYHGAEHKTIHCYEHGLELTPENARQFPRLHVRCGTAFLITVMIIAIIVYTIIPVNALISALGITNGALQLVLVIAIRIIFMPIIAGITYEITVKWAGTHPENPAVKVILWPGLRMQYLTTYEPDDSMLECAIAAMQRVLEYEEEYAAEKALEEHAEKAFAT